MLAIYNLWFFLKILFSFFLTWTNNFFFIIWLNIKILRLRHTFTFLSSFYFGCILYCFPAPTVAELQICTNISRTVQIFPIDWLVKPLWPNFYCMLWFNIYIGGIFHSWVKGAFNVNYCLRKLSSNLLRILYSCKKRKENWQNLVLYKLT